MFSSSKRRGKARGTSSRTASARVHRAIQSAIEPLESRVLMTTVTYNVTGNSDTVADVITPAGVNTYKANSLRAAIDSANNQPFATVIQFTAANFPGGAANTITLAKGGLTLGSMTENHTWKIVGNTAKPITVSGANLYTVFTSLATDSLEVDNLTIAHGNSSVEGGAIDAFTSLTLNGDTFASNHAANFGGAVESLFGTFSATNCLFTGNSSTDGGAFSTGTLDIGLAPVFTGCTFTGNTASDHAGAINVAADSAGATLTITKCTFTGNTSAGEGGAVETYSFAPGGSVATTITGSTFSGNSAFDDGGAIYDDSGTSLTLGTDVFVNNKSIDGYGGAVYAVDKSLSVTNSTFSGDSAYDSGGGIYFDGAGATPTLTVTGSSLTNEKSLEESGGAIDNVGAPGTVAKITSSTFTGDVALDFGGGIYSLGGATTSLTITNSKFTNDTAQFDAGGGVYTTDATVTISGTTFTNDRANDDEGGGLWSDATSLTVASSSFINDLAIDDGGGIYFDGADATVSDSTFTGDVTTEYGGGIYSYADTLSVHNSTFTNDSAKYGGGGIFSADTLLTVDPTTFTGDIATDGDGGGIYFAGITANVTDTTFTNDSANNGDGGGIYVGTYEDEEDAKPAVKKPAEYNNGSVTLNVATSTFTDDTADYSGGGIYFGDYSYYQEGEVTPAIDGYSELNIAQSTFTSDTAEYAGGGVYAVGYYYEDSLGIYDSTFDSNTATLTGGGGLYTQMPFAQIANNTFYGNVAGPTAIGGGIYVSEGFNANVKAPAQIGDDEVIITDNTIDANTAGYNLGGGIGIGNIAFQDVLLDGNIIALNTATGTPNTTDDLEGSYDPASTSNIIGNIGNAGVVAGFTAGFHGGNFVGSNLLSPIDPLLSPLADNGGPTQTQAIAPDSLAVDNNNDFPVYDQNDQDVTATDQRGIDRPQGDGYDIGSFELVPALADHFVIVAPATATKGVPITVVVQAVTPLNQPDNTFSEPVTITTTDAAATGLPGPGTLTFTNGVATFTPTLNTVGSFTFTVTDTQPGTGVAPATSSPPTVVTAPTAVIPKISISNATAAAPTSGTSTVPMKFTVTLSASPTSAVTVTYGTMQGTASSGHGDYVGVPSATLTFAANATGAALTQTITIQIKKATFPAATYAGPYTPSHPGVYFYVLLSNANNALLGNATGIGTILY